MNGIKTEKVCYSILSKDTEFNSCYVRQKCWSNHVLQWKSCILQKDISTYSDILRRIPLPKDRETYEKAKKQLEIIHRNGIIHRDIREDNILYSKEGLVYIIDFALAKPKINIYIADWSKTILIS